MVMLDYSDYQVQYTAAYRLLKFDPHGLADELLEIYGLTLDCHVTISTCLAGKPYSVLLQRGRFVCCLESRGHYARAEAEADASLDALRCVLSPAASAKLV